MPSIFLSLSILLHCLRCYKLIGIVFQGLYLTSCNLLLIEVLQPDPGAACGTSHEVS